MKDPEQKTRDKYMPGHCATPAVSDKSLCPLCNNINNCAMETNKNSTSCWCQQTTIDSQLLEKAHNMGSYNTCICQSCAEKASELSKEIK